MPGIAARRPNNHHHSISKKSDRLEAGFAIVPPCVLHRDRRAGKNDRGIGKIQTSLAEAAWRFAGSNVIFSQLNVPPFNCSRQAFR